MCLCGKLVRDGDKLLAGLQVGAAPKGCGSYGR